MKAAFIGVLAASAFAQSTTVSTTTVTTATTTAVATTTNLMGQCYKSNRKTTTSTTTTTTTTVLPTTTTAAAAKATNPAAAPKQPAAQPKQNETQRKRPTTKQPAKQPPKQPKQPSAPAPKQPKRPSQPSYPANSYISDCLDTFNTARWNEDRGPALSWDPWLAERAENSASYCANVEQEHTDVVGGQILFITKTSCSSGIKGWFHDEKPYRGGHYMIIKNHKYSRVGCATVRSGSRCISCNFR
jgi:hypothetical protein